MPSSYEKEALKAQAICARSYAVNRIRDHAYEKYGADLDDTTACQVYNNIFETPETIEAVQETAGEVLTCDGDMVQAYFFLLHAEPHAEMMMYGEEINCHI